MHFSFTTFDLNERKQTNDNNIENRYAQKANNSILITQLLKPMLKRKKNLIKQQQQQFYKIKQNKKKPE